MDYRSLHMKTVAELRQLAKDENIKIPAGTKKNVMVEMLVAATEQREPAQAAPVQTAPVQAAPVQAAPVIAEPAKPEPKKRGRKPKSAYIENVVQSAAEEKTPEPEPSVTEEAPAPAVEEKVVIEDKPEAAQSVPQPMRRPLSTQQRMGARTHPAMNTFRPQPQNGRPPMQQGARPMQRTQDAQPSRPVRTYEQPSRPAQVPDAQPTRRYSPTPQQQEQRTMSAAEAMRQTYAALNEPTPAYDDRRSLNAAVPDILASGECGDGEGILEIHADGYGFLRADNYLPGNRDVYVSAAQIRRFNLRTGDHVVGKTRAQQAGDRSVGLIYISEVNGQSPDAARNRRPFDSLTPVYPNERLRMERSGSRDISLRLIDMIAPIGKGQRGMIVSPPKAGKTTLLKQIANAITENNPEVHLMVLLIDERPEEVTDIQRSVQGEVIYSTFDEAPENHTRVSEMVLERSQRLVEMGKDVVILLDSITRLARAYNLVIPPTGRSLSGGLDPGALYRPKRFFGAARNIEGGGSLTIIATALVDTGSRMDDIIFEEFKGTGNMELHLDRSLSDRRIFPAIDMYKSGTRREELLLDSTELDGVYQMRRMLSKGSTQDAAEQLISLMQKTRTNSEFYQKLKGWMNVCEKDGFK